MSTLDLKANSFSLANARELALYARMAYDEPPTVQSKVTDTQVLICELDDCVVVAPRGTSNLRDFVTDAECWLVKTPIGRIHHGFWTAWASVEDQVIQKLEPLRDKPILFGAHSLGGSLGNVGARRLNDAMFKVHSVYTYGCPRSGNAEFQTRYNLTATRFSPFTTLGAATFGVINDCDGIARMPGYLSGYRRPGHDEFISALDDSKIVEDPVVSYRLESDLWALFNGWRARRNLTFLNQLLADHHIDKYIAALAVLRGDEAVPTLPL